MENLNSPQLYLTMLSNEIEKQNGSLQTYSQRPNSNQEYIKRQFAHLELLAKVHNGFEAVLQNAELVLPLADICSDLLRKDPEIGRFLINLWVKPYNDRIGLVNYNPFESW